jgi:hypothetical protein
VSAQECDPVNQAQFLLNAANNKYDVLSDRQIKDAGSHITMIQNIRRQLDGFSEAGRKYFERFFVVSLPMSQHAELNLYPLSVEANRYI